MVAKIFLSHLVKLQVRYIVFGICVFMFHKTVGKTAVITQSRYGLLHKPLIISEGIISETSLQ